MYAVPVVRSLGNQLLSGIRYLSGISGEYYNPEIMRSASSTELHRQMSWVMAESGVPWEENDDTWCCPECFILYSLNVFRVRKRAVGRE